MHSVTSKKFREHGLYRLAKNKAMQKYSGCVRNTLQQKHQVKFDFWAKLDKDGNLTESPEGYYVKADINEHALRVVLIAMRGFDGC